MGKHRLRGSDDEQWPTDDPDKNFDQTIRNFPVPDIPPIVDPTKEED